MPAAAGGLDGMDGAGPVNAAGGEADQRDRPHPGIDRMDFAGDPLHPFRPRGDAAAFAGAALDQRQVELAAVEIAAQMHALVGADVEPQAGARSRAARQQFGQAVGGKILGDAKPHHAVTGRPRQHVPRFLGERQQPPGV